MRLIQAYLLFTAFLLSAMVWLGCSDTAPSASLEEAQKIHAQLDRLSSDVHAELQMALEATEARIESSLAIGDSLVAMQLARVESQLGELDVRFHDWEATVAPLPGAVCNHDHDHDHAHDHAGHDHDHDHAHDHDHGSSASMEGMSDQAILEIQQALMAELLAMKDALKQASSSLEANENASDEE
jgi:outer membrane murein-binding lipoprotein Lpp